MLTIIGHRSNFKQQFFSSIYEETANKFLADAKSVPNDSVKHLGEVAFKNLSSFLVEEEKAYYNTACVEAYIDANIQNKEDFDSIEKMEDDILDGKDDGFIAFEKEYMKTTPLNQEYTYFTLINFTTNRIIFVYKEE